MSGSPGTGGSNPRKFSEKIALHNQKQAEETRAFEQLMTDLTVSRQCIKEGAQHIALGDAGAQGEDGGRCRPNLTVDEEIQNPVAYGGSEREDCIESHTDGVLSQCVFPVGKPALVEVSRGSVFDVGEYVSFKAF
eukprot:superscaffoldBa00003349_g16721